MLSTDLIRLISHYLPCLVIPSVAYDENWYKTHLQLKYPALNFNRKTGWSELYQLSLSSGLPHRLLETFELEKQSFCNVPCIDVTFSGQLLCEFLLAFNGDLYAYHSVNFPAGQLLDTGVTMILQEMYVKTVSREAGMPTFQWYFIESVWPLKKKLLLDTDQPILKLEVNHSAMLVYLALTSTSLYHHCRHRFSAQAVNEIPLTACGIGPAVNMSSLRYDLIHDSTGRVVGWSWRTGQTFTVAENVARLDGEVIVYRSGKWKIVVDVPGVENHLGLAEISGMPAPDKIIPLDTKYLLACSGSLLTIPKPPETTFKPTNLSKGSDWERRMVKLCGTDCNPVLLLSI